MHARLALSGSRAAPRRASHHTRSARHDGLRAMRPACLRRDLQRVASSPAPPIRPNRDRHFGGGGPRTRARARERNEVGFGMGGTGCGSASEMLVGGPGSIRCIGNASTTPPTTRPHLPRPPTESPTPVRDVIHRFVVNRTSASVVRDGLRTRGSDCWRLALWSRGVSRGTCVRRRSPPRSRTLRVRRGTR